MLFSLEFQDLFDLVRVLLLDFKQHLAHLGEVHPCHLLIQGLVVSVAHQDALLQMDLVVSELQFGLHEVFVVSADAGFVLIG